MEIETKHKLGPKYKAMLVLGKKIYKTQFIFGEIPDVIDYGARKLKLKMVLWNCKNNAVLDKYKFVEIKLLVYR